MWRQTVQLLIKNLIILRRNWKQLLGEFFVPVYFVFLLLLLQHSTDTLLENEKEVLSYPPIKVPSLGVICKESEQKLCHLAYSSDGVEFNKNVVKTIEKQPENVPSKFDGENKDMEAEILYLSTIGTNSYIYGVVNFYYNQLANHNSTLPPKKIEIAVDSFLIPNVFDSMQYISSGWISIQKACEESIVSNLVSAEATGRSTTFNIETKRFPHKAQESEINPLVYIVPYYVPFVYGYTIQVIVVAVVIEKEKKIKSLLQLIGMKESSYWLSWILLRIPIQLISSLLFTAAIMAAGIFEQSNPLILFSIFFVFSISDLTIGFILASFCSSSKMGVIASWGWNFLAMFLLGGSHVLSVGRSSVGKILIWVFSIFSIVPMSELSFALADTEYVTKQGIQFSTLFQVDDARPYPLIVAILIILLDSFLYYWVAIYISQVIPGEFGIKKPFWFPLSSLVRHTDASAGILLDPIENVGSSEKSIQVLNIIKKYGKVVAVNDVSLDIWKGEVLAVLGQNGAGKTTLISIMSGLTQPTSGLAIVNGKNISESPETRIIGLCAQEDVLFDFLNGYEHLRLVSSFTEQHNNENKISDILRAVGLSNEEALKISKNCSGGMKRKLCTAIALIGNPAIVLLDEPTAGLDPLSRQKIWKLLQDYKMDKTIILTTHSLEEAELLGDRIVIMNHGKVQCCGTAMEIKSEYTSGYRLVLTLDTNTPSQRERISQFVFELLRCENQQQQQENDEGEQQHALPCTEMVLNIPSIDSPKIVELAKQLNFNKQRLGISMFSFEKMTLEEAFLKMCENDVDSSQ